VFSRIKGSFKQDHFAFEIIHDDSVEQGTIVNGVAHQMLDFVPASKSESKSLFSAKANLRLAHGQKVVWEFDFDIKDPGDLVIESLTFEISTPAFHFDFVITPEHFAKPFKWYIQESSEVMIEKKVYRNTPWFSDIKPKPPKFEVTIEDLQRALYTDEPVEITFHVENGEDEQVSSASLDIRILSRDTPPEISWAVEASEDSRNLAIAPMQPDQKLSYSARFTSPPKPTTLILEARLHYYLPSDPEIPLSKTFSTELMVQSPFEANYEFTARIHSDPWPSYFTMGNSVPGLLQRWSILASIASFAEETLLVESVSFDIENKSQGLMCTLFKESIDDGTEISPKTMKNHEFLLDTVRPSLTSKLHDRASSITGNLKITWKKHASDNLSVVSTIPVSPFSLPPLEPRVVASANHVGMAEDTPLTLLSLHLENPTLHPLTFDITTPSSEVLAFSGPKQLVVTILPYSRTQVDYRVLPLVGKGVWVDMMIKVSDRYFVREVDVLPGEGLTPGENGAVRWWTG
jgi:trafficking protein particle complex subunit 11